MKVLYSKLMLRISKYISFLLFINILITGEIYSQYNSINRFIHWNDNNFQDDSLKLNFIGALYPDTSNKFPYYKESFELPFHTDIAISNINYEKIDQNLVNKILNHSQLPDTFIFSQFSGMSRKKYIIQVTLLPVWRDKKSMIVYRLTSFSLSFPSNTMKRLNITNNQYKEHSILSNGFWYKIKLNKDGVYKLTYEKLKQMGFAYPENVRIYGNGGGMLPLKVNKPRPDDLYENSILYVAGSDNVFNEGDYILFYGQGPDIWNYNLTSKRFFCSQHKFSDYSYYFLTDYYGKGKQVDTSIYNLTDNIINATSFDDYTYHEVDLNNFLRSGSEWYGEKLDVFNTLSFSVDFQNIDYSSTAYFYYNVASRSGSLSNFLFGIFGKQYLSPYISNTDKLNLDASYAYSVSGNFTFTPSSDNITVDVGYESSGDQGAEGYINYFGLNVRRKLIFEGSQMHFRDVSSIGPGNTTNFIINNASEDPEIWDITNLYSPGRVITSVSGTTLTFKASSDTLRQYIIFNKASGFLSPITDGNDVGPIEYQDLHGSTIPNLIIVAPPDTEIFRQAQILANFRKNNDGLKVLITTTDKIYNEFSSGKKDIVAIRDMVKMFYDRSSDDNDMPKYLLLFGDGTYDNKTPVKEGNNNYVPTYQSSNSFVRTFSYVTDDFYGWLDDTVSDQSNLLDIGVGRLPVNNAEEAKVVVDKILNYSNPSTMGDWRNVICFIGDDGDGNTHVNQANELADGIGSSYPNFVIQKIYVDAFPFITSSVGQRCPDINNAINNRVNKGALIINYTGHGNTSQLAHQVIINKASILSWKNFNKLPLFITATCEFSRFDDLNIVTPGKQFEEKKSGGENILLNPNGGGIALLSTSRVVFSDANFDLNLAIYDTLFTKDKHNEFLRLGDVMRLAKNSLGNSLNKLNFTLLGDPSIVLAYPKGNGIITDSINGVSVKSSEDTLKALSLAKVSGHIEDEYGNLMNNYKGLLHTTVFDKEEKRTTIGNDENTPFSYLVRDNIIFKGISNITDGKFIIEFPVPKDINYNFDKGKIVYYANDSISDIAGFSYDLIIGGIDNNSDIDNVGPIINLFMNDTNFVSGGITNPNPVLLVKLYDNDGINITGIGIGHDINAIIDNDLSNLASLNDYFQYEVNNFRKGFALYPLYNISPGEHTIKVIAWDIYNNPSDATISFNVIESNNLIIKNVINYPNPFSNFTYFVFEHNSPDEAIDIEIRIYNTSGQLIKILRDNIMSGFRTMPIQWNGRDNKGRLAGQGIYFYKIFTNTKSGKHSENYGKMVIVRTK